ncbi:MAG: sodium:calcium antiporter [Promethearchaeota archaeon]
MLNIILWIFLFIIGYLIIFFAADVFLDNLKEICLIYRISPFIIGLIILGIDPEESIASIIAAINGLPYIAVGNVIGNSITALTIPFALPALLYKTNFESVAQYYFNLIYISLLCILSAILIYLGLLFAGICCIIIYIIYLIRNLRNIATKKKPINIISDEIKNIQLFSEKDTKPKKYKTFILVIIGFTFIFLGGELLIISAENIIMLTFIPESFFGFVIIAIVTNVEEITLMLKSIKKQSVEIGLGGMIGKIIWNLTLTFGISGMIAMNIPFAWISVWNWLILLLLIIYFNYISYKRSLEKIEGLVLITIFICFISINFISIGL